MNEIALWAVLTDSDLCKEIVHDARREEYVWFSRIHWESLVISVVCSNVLVASTAQLEHGNRFHFDPL